MRDAAVVIFPRIGTGSSRKRTARPQLAKN